MRRPARTKTELTTADFSVLHHALDICESDYDQDGLGTVQLKTIDRVRNKLFDIQNERKTHAKRRKRK